MNIPVSELLVRFMERLGIECIFGMPGAHILPVYDSLYDSSIRAILAKHEQGASFMACGFTRASGKIGACISTAGPGATNLVTGVANAYVDRQPMLVITGETSTPIFGRGGLQESSGEGGSVDQQALFSSITLYSKLVERTDYLPNVLNRAAKLLQAQSSGPVLLSFPFNLQKELIDEAVLDDIRFDPADTRCAVAPPAVDDMVDLIAAARHPVIIAGYGCLLADAQQQLSSLSKTYNIPVTSSLKGKGAIDESAALSLGSVGVTSYTQARDYIVEHADLLIILGASLNERTSYVWDRKLMADKKRVQVDINAEQLEKVIRADVAIQADIGVVLDHVLEQLQRRNVRPRQLATLPEKPLKPSPVDRETDIQELQEKFPLVEQFFNCLGRYFQSGIQVFDDNIIFAQNFFNVSVDNRFYSNSGVSSLGHAIPAAIGARFAETRPTFAVIGDGGFQMCCMELMTAVNYQIPVNVLLLNNSSMGLIRKNQHQQYDQRFINCDFVNPDYPMLAQSFGINHYRIDNEQDLHQLFTQADLADSINLIEIVLDKHVFPNYQSRR